MKNALNTIAKKKFFNEYKFPRCTRDKAIIEASDSGWGFKTKYELDWAGVISEEEFAVHIREVNRVCYQVFDMQKREEGGSSTRTIEGIVNFAIVIVMIACGLAVLGSTASDILGKYVEINLYLTILLIVVSHTDEGRLYHYVQRHYIRPASRLRVLGGPQRTGPQTEQSVE